MFDPRDDARDRDGREDGRARVYDERDRDGDPREGLMRNLDLPRARSASWSWSVTTSTSWTARIAGRWPPSARSGSCPNAPSMSTARRSNTCATWASSRRWRWATPRAG
jgi:hypothetical protein